MKHNKNKLINEEHYILVKGWDSVQEYLGTKIGQMETRKLGIKVYGKSKRGRGVKNIYMIPYKALVSRMITNQRKLSRLKRSVKLIRNRFSKDPIMKKYLDV